MGRNGENQTAVMTLDPRYDFQGPKWSPDGRSIVYRKNKFGSREGSIEARTIADGTTKVVHTGSGLQDFWWTADGRLIYSQATTSEDTHDLWELHIDSETSQPSAEPRRLTRWVGYAPGLVSVSSDGKRIVTTKGYHQTDVYVADLDADGHHVKTEKRLTADTRFDWPGGWTRDGKDVVFFSDRNGVFNVFKQSEATSNTDIVVSGREDSRSPQISPDGQWLLYMVWPNDKAPGPVRMMRASMSRTATEPVLEANGTFARGITFTVEGEQDIQKGATRTFPDFRCPSASENASCVLAEAEQEEILFTFFDPVRGRGNEAARVRASPAKFFWDLSPDGTQLAYGEFKSVESDSIAFVTLKGGTTRQLQLSGHTNLSSLSWASGGRSLYVTTKRREGSDLLHVGLDGTVTVMREETGRVFLSPRPSPNGRRLAYAIRTTDSNVWLLETK